MVLQGNSVAKSPAEIVREGLAPILGQHTAKTAVLMTAKQSFKTDPEKLTRAQIPILLDALGPILRTLIGRASAEQVVDRIKRELELS